MSNDNPVRFRSSSLPNGIQRVHLNARIGIWSESLRIRFACAVSVSIALYDMANRPSCLLDDIVAVFVNLFCEIFSAHEGAKCMRPGPRQCHSHPWEQMDYACKMLKYNCDIWCVCARARRVCLRWLRSIVSSLRCGLFRDVCKYFGVNLADD